MQGLDAVVAAQASCM